MEPKRLDLLLMELRGFSRAYAREVIEAGMVQVNGKPEKRPGRKAMPREITAQAPDMPYVSRGGLKLEAALNAFSIVLEGAVCLDAGASTGGFTDCMLKRGAAKVYAADVGRGQLADTLREDERVVPMEGVDIRGLELPEPVGFASADLSFISLTAVIPSLYKLIKPDGLLVCLIKPEFETYGKGLNKSGVVKNEQYRDMARNRVLTGLTEAGFRVLGCIPSPITGRDGNAEYLAVSRRA